MGGYFNQITDEQADLIRSSEVFFIATADPELRSGPKNVGPINLSPKGATPLHIITPNLVAYLDYAGSGNETARHAATGGPVTIHGLLIWGCGCGHRTALRKGIRDE